MDIDTVIATRLVIETARDREFASLKFCRIWLQQMATVVFTDYDVIEGCVNADLILKM